MNAHRVAIKGLKGVGLLKGDEQEIFDKRVSVAFFPHGLGHYLGMDTHDTGGKANYADPDTMFRYLRVRGHLPRNSVITVEPGVCAPHLLDGYEFNILADLFLPVPHQPIPAKSGAKQIHQQSKT